MSTTIVKGNKASLSAPGFAASSELHDAEVLNKKMFGQVATIVQITCHHECFKTHYYTEGTRALSMKNNEGQAITRVQLFATKA